MTTFETPRRATGPVTPEGKARSSQNARTHGFTAKSVNLAPEDRAAFEALQLDLRHQILPSGCLEEEVFHRILSHTWNLRRIEAVESLLLAAMDPFAETDSHAAKLERYARYRRDLERSLFRCMKELRALQTERMALRALCPEDAELILESAPFAEVMRFTKRTTPPRRKLAGPAQPQPPAQPHPLPRSA